MEVLAVALKLWDKTLGWLEESYWLLIWGTGRSIMAYDEACMHIILIRFALHRKKLPT